MTDELWKANGVGASHKMAAVVILSMIAGALSSKTSVNWLPVPPRKQTA